MTRFHRFFALIALTATIALSSGCASTMMVGEQDAENFYEENPVAMVVMPVDVALGVPLFTLDFVINNLDEIILINDELRKNGVY